MPFVPESRLQDILKQPLHVTSKRDELRKTAFRWFNRLYYDIRGWNESFIKFLHTYPGFKNSVSEEEYNIFFRELEDYEISLRKGERAGLWEYDESPRPSKDESEPYLINYPENDPHFRALCET